MAFSPVLTFHLASPDRACRFSISAADLGGRILTEPIEPGDYQRLVVTFANAMREPANHAGAVALATLALVMLFGHPLYGPDAKRNVSDALRSFGAIVIAVVVDEVGVGFSIGNDGDVHDLRQRLDQMEGSVDTGEIGPWPAAPMPH